MAAGDVIVRFLGDTTKLDKSLGHVQTKLEGFGTKINKASMVAAGGLAVLATGAVGAIHQAEALSTANSRLEQVFSQMGDKTGKAAKQAEAYANALSTKIGVDKADIELTQAKLATFSAVSDAAARQAGIFDRATNAAHDLAAAGFGDAATNAVQLGKALQDPVKGLAALNRVGVTFSDSQKAQIKAMVASGHQLDAQKVLLKAIETQVGGTAAATVNDTDKMAVSWHNIQASLGNALLPILHTVTGAFGGMSEWISKNSSEVTKIIAVVAAFMAGLVALRLIVFTITTATKAYTEIMKIWEVATKAVAMAQKALNLAMEMNPIGIIIIAVTALIAVFVLAYNHSAKFRDIVQATWKGIHDAIVTAAHAIGVVVSAVWDAMKAYFNYNPLVIIVKHWSAIVAFFKSIPSKIGAVLENLASVLTAPFRMAFNAIASLWNNTIGKMSFHLPSWIPGIGGKGFSMPTIPMLADGGIVRASNGGTLALLGEGGRDEAVVPLDNGMPLGGGDVLARLDSLERAIRELPRAFARETLAEARRG